MQQSDLISQLECLVSSGDLPRKLQASAAMLLGRLQSVINVRLMGPDRDRMSDLIALVTKCQIPDVPSAEIWVQHGERAEVTVHFHDGSSRYFNGEPMQFDVAPVRIDVAVPLPAFELVSFHLVGQLDADRDAPLQGSHAFQDADIVLWCTTRFAADEAAQWNSAPDNLKGHSFLVRLTQDEQPDTELNAALDAVAEQHFYGLHNIRLSDGSTSAPAKLMSKISQIAKSGRIADQDNAALLLKTYKNVVKTATRIEPALMPLRRPSAAPKRLSGLYAQALQLVRDCAQEIADPLPRDCPEDFSQILSQCAQASQELAELFEDAMDEDPLFQALKTDVLTASDQLTLMTMEPGMQPALDAVTTLVQLKRDFEMQCAA